MSKLLTTIMTFSLLASFSSAAKDTKCSIVSIPEVAFNKAPVVVAIDYSLSEEIDSAQLHVELKDLSHHVLVSQTREVRGAGVERAALPVEESFEFECPKSQDKLIVVAAWMGEDWREPLYPIQRSEPLPVLPHDAYKQKLAAENADPAEVRQKLSSLGYERATGNNVALLNPDISKFDQQVIDHYAQVLSSAGFEVTKLSLDYLTDAAILSPEYFDLLMLTDIRLFPTSAIFPFTRYLRNGGKLIAFGAPAFQKRIWHSGKRWITEDSYADALKKTEPSQILLDFESGSLEKWHRAARNPQTHTEHSILERASGSLCLRVKIDELDGWDTFVSPSLEDENLPKDALTIFWAKGDKNTHHLVVEWKEKDRSRWITTVDLDTEWKRYVLTPSDFEYWRDNPSEGRGGPDDHFHPENAYKISFGVATGFAHYKDRASYAYWVDDVGFAENPETPPPDKYELQLPVISPHYKIYQLGKVEKLWLSAPYVRDENSFSISIEDAWFPMPRHHGGGFHRNRKRRFIHLLDARKKDGTYRGSVGAMLLNTAGDWFPSAWLTVGTAERNVLTSDAITKTVIDAAQRLQKGIFLSEAGAEHCSYYPDELMNAGAEIINISHKEQSAVLKMTLHDGSGERAVIMEKKVVVSPSEDERAETKLKAPDTPNSEWFIETELLVDGERIDFTYQRLNVLAEPVKDPSEYVTVSDGDFYLHGKKWYPYGINYWPCYIAGDEPYRRFGPYYNPELVERDLRQMEKMGMNMISIQTSLSHHRDLLDLIARAYKHGIRTNLFLTGSDPLRFDEEIVAKQIEGWKLDSNPAVFAYDLAWEHRLGNYDRRRQWDDEWSDWIRERYGSIETAEKDWGFAVPRFAGKITGPSDEQLTEDGPWRVMVAAYRRFVDDFVSRKYRQAVKIVKEMAPNQLVSVRMGYGGTGPCSPSVFPVDLRSVAKHLDFLSPEGWGMNGTREQVLSGGITTAYSNWASRGKPCFWCEWGMNVWNKSTMSPDPKRIEVQGQQYRYFCEMFSRSGANGQAAWWLPGGFRVGENSDFGILAPDATWRPACHVLKEWAPKLKKSRSRPKPDRWITIDRDSHPGGYWHVYNAHKDEYAQALENGHLIGIKTEGTGTTSRNVPLVAVGNTEYNGSNPPKYLNAEFNRLELKNANGQWIAVSDGDLVKINPDKPLMVRASVGNTGETKWIASEQSAEKGAVYLSSRTKGDFNLGPISKDTPYLHDAEVAPFVFADSVSGKTTVKFEMTANRRVWFGEKIRVILVPIY